MTCIYTYIYIYTHTYITQNSIEVDAETKESTRKTEEKLDGRYTVAQKERIFSNNCNFFIFNIKNMLTPKQPVINAVLITYIDYSITENFIGKMESFLPYTRPEPLLKVLHHIY